MKSTSFVRWSVCLFFIFCFSLFGFLQAQESAFVAERQDMALLPGDVSSVCLMDSDLYCCAAQVLMKAQRSAEGRLAGMWVDTAVARMGQNVTYVVRHPSTGDIYFTQGDGRGGSDLYRRYVREDGKAKVVRVKMNKLDVEHPTFTADGQVMVFSATDKNRGFGGYDLWYSMLEDGEWTNPVNLGGRINTSRDETAPFIYRDCIIFSSNGHEKNRMFTNIFASRLLSEASGRLQISRCRVQKLPAPFNSADADDRDMVIDGQNGCGYWVSRRSGREQLYMFSGPLEGVLLSGRVSDKNDSLLAGVEVTARQDGIVVAQTVTDEEGFYLLTLRCDQQYDVSYRLGGYFTETESVAATNKDKEYLMAEVRRNVVLDGLLVGQRMYFDDLFGPGVSVELSGYGREKIAPLVRFMHDNPSLSARMSLMSDMTDDASFNTMLTEHRLQVLKQFFMQSLPPSVKLALVNGCSESNCSSASGQTRLVVVMSSPRK